MFFTSFFMFGGSILGSIAIQAMGVTFLVTDVTSLVTVGPISSHGRYRIVRCEESI